MNANSYNIAAYYFKTADHELFNNDRELFTIIILSNDDLSVKTRGTLQVAYIAPITIHLVPYTIAQIHTNVITQQTCTIQTETCHNYLNHKTD